MLQIILYSCILITSLTFMQMNHPLAMGLILLIQTLIVCLVTGMMTKTFWFSYVLFLIFLGGMLVLFIYVTSLASNEMFSLSMNLTIMATLLISLTLMTTLLMDKFMITNVMENNEMTLTNNLMNLIQENSFNINKLYNYPTNMITLMMINYLLITLIAIVKITNIFHGPLRHTFN